MSDKILSAEHVATLHPGDPDFELSKLCNSHEALRAERDAAREALRLLEWNGSSQNPGGSYCLECNNWREDGHTETCAIGNALSDDRVKT